MKQWKVVIPLVLLMAIQYVYFEHQLEQARNLPDAFNKPTESPVVNHLQLPELSVLAARAKQSVVSIEVSDRESFSRLNGVGSGFIISDDGYLLTNHHVTEDAVALLVKLADGQEYDARLVGSDPETDLALLKIDAQGLRPFEFGSVEQARVGAWVVAIGAPFGFEQSVTAGIISAKRRSVGEQYVPYIQTDVAINVGNSGGPLINMDGKVIGVNSKIISTDGGSLGLSFAIPIDLAVDVINQLKNYGRVSRGFLGVGYQRVTRDLADNFSLKHNFGALINAVSGNSPAAQGGLQVGDIVTAVDGRQISNHTELPFLIGRLRPGMETELSIIRDGAKSAIKIIVGNREPRDLVFTDTTPQGFSPKELLNIEVSETAEAAAQIPGANGGMLVERVAEGPAMDAGLRAGDIIVSIQSTPVQTLEEFEAVIASLPATGSFSMLISRPDEGFEYLILALDR